MAKFRSLFHTFMNKAGAVVAPKQIVVPVVAERCAKSLADIPFDKLREIIASLNERAADLGCVVAGDDPESNVAVVIFAGNQERFHMMAAAQHLRCKVVYLQDLASGWYQGSEVAPDLNTLCDGFLKNEIGNRRALFFGQSSGAYAAILASTHFRGSTVVACAPQTKPDAAVKNRIQFVGVRPLVTPNDIIDVKKQLLRASDSDASLTVVIASSESNNPVQAHFWMDYLHALHLSDVPNVQVSIVNFNSHAIVHGNVRAYAELLRQLAAVLYEPAARRNAISREFLESTYGLF